MNETRRSPPRVLADQVGELAHDAVVLSELQGRLFLVDARKCMQTIRLPIALLLGGMILATASCTALVFSGGYALTELTPLPLSAALAIVGAAAMLVTGGIVALGFTLTKQSFASFERSQKELTRNIEWLKQTVSQNRSRRREEERLLESLPFNPRWEP